MSSFFDDTLQQSIDALQSTLDSPTSTLTDGSNLGHDVHSSSALDYNPVTETYQTDYSSTLTDVSNLGHDVHFRS